MSNSLPMARKPNLTAADVRDYLIELRGQGWDAVEESGSRFRINFSIDQHVLIAPRAENTWNVSHVTGGAAYLVGAPESVLELEHAIGKVIGSKRPVYARAKEQQPASNARRFVELAQGSEVLALYDPYLNNKALAALLDYRSLGMRFDAAVRLLTSPKMVQQREISASYAQTWFTEIGAATGELRQVNGKPHKRFFLLSGSKAMTFDFSINEPSKEGDIDIRDDREDRDYFERHWSSAVAVP